MSELKLENIDLGAFGVKEKQEDLTGLETQQLQSTMSEAVKIEPDKYAKNLSLSQQSGVPEFAVESDPHSVESQLKLDSIDFSQMSKRSPNTAGFYSDFNKASIAHDEIDLMEEIESVFNFEKTFSGFGESVGLSFESQAKGLAAFSIDRSSSRIEDIVPAGALPLGVEQYSGIMSRDIAASFGITTDEELEQAKTEAVDNIVSELKEINERRKAIAPQDLNLVEQGVRAGFESLVTNAPGLALSVVSGTATPGLVALGLQSFGDSYGNARAEGLAADEAAAKAGIDAAIEVGTEVIPLKTLERIITGKSEGLTKKALKFFAQEMTSEQIATLGQTLNDYAFGLDEQLENASSVAEMVDIQLQRQAVTAIATLVSGGVQATVATGINKTIEALANDESQKEAQDEADQRTIDSLNETTGNSKTRERNAESFKQFIEQSAGEQVTDIFLDATQTSLYLSSKSRREIEADPALTLLADAVEEAGVSGADAQVKIEDFTTSITGTEHFTALRDFMTLTAETDSPFRKEQQQEETRDYVGRLVEEAETNASEYIQAQEIFNTVRDQLIDTGQVSAQAASQMAQLVPAWATVHAKKNGTSVEQVYRDSGLTIEGPQTGERERLAGEAERLEQQVIDQLPKDSVDIFRAYARMEGNPEDLMTLTKQLTGQHKGIHSIEDKPDYVSDESLAEIPNPAFIQSNTKLLTHVFTDNGDVYRVIGKTGEVVKLTEEETENYASRTLLKIYNDIRDASPEAQAAKEQRRKEQEEQRRRDKRIQDAPKATGDFDADVKAFAEYADNFEEFKQLLSADMMDVSDRNRTRIARAVIALDPEVETAANVVEVQPDMIKDVKSFGSPAERAAANAIDSKSKTITIYRAMPATGKIEAGDWVGLVKSYAKSHESNTVGEKATTRQKTVPKEDLYWYGADFNEWVYIPKGTWGNYTSLQDVWSDLAPNKPLTYETEQLQQQPQGKTVTRGYYEPANSLIRLTESADLSTFLHEFAHFMYEMEIKSGGLTLQQINGWYKRNNEAVAKEANKYLGEEYDTLNQGAVDTIDQRKQRAREQGFDVDTTLYHGTPRDVKEFRVDKIGSTSDEGYHGEGFYFSENKAYASSYAGKYRGTPNVIPVYLKAEKPFIRASSATHGIDWRNVAKEQYAEIGIDENTSASERTRLLQEAGYDSLIIYELDEDGNKRIFEQVIFDPKNIRSVNAQFKDADSADLLAQSQQPPEGKAGSITEADVVNYLDTGSSGNLDKDNAVRRAVHEQFARGFETYLMEGKAPSIELRNAFRTFARWLGQIYRAIRGDLKVNLDDDMRQVFDRLLATDEQIQAAEARARFEPLFTDAAMAGMTEEQFNTYQQNQQKMKEKSTETLRDQLINEITRQTQKWWEEERADIVEEEKQRLANESVYRATEGLRHGEVKLDHATVKEMVGEMREDKLGRKSTVIPSKLRGMTAKGQQGVHPDDAAAFFGYGSGEQMLNDIITEPTLNDAVEQNADAIMLDRHGDIMNDGTIQQRADEAVQNEERGKLILQELKALATGTTQPALDRQTIKALAEERIGKLSFREIHPAKYRKAEIQAAQETARMLAEGNREGAARAKARQVTNYYLSMAATNAKNETVKIVDRMGRYNKKTVREAIIRAENGYWEQLTKILNRFEFRKTATLKSVDEVNQSLNEWARERVEVDGDGLILSAAVLDESYVTHWKNVPFADLQGVNDSVKNIEHVARYSNRMRTQQEEIDFKKLVNKWVTSMNENAEDRFVPQRITVAEGRKWGRWAMAQMTKIPFMASWLDGGERAGISHDILVQPMTDAYNAELTMWDEIGKPVLALINDRSKDDMARHNRKVFIPEIQDETNDGNLMGHQILSVALNTGNESNLRKLLLGEGWASEDAEGSISMDNPKLQAVLSRMTKSDWELVQAMWDQMELLYPQLAEVHRRTTGLTPPKVEATPIETEFGSFRGGYYPVKYDPNRSFRAQQNEDRLNAETESMFGQVGIQASVNASSTNERTGYYAPIRLSLDVVPNHFQETIHYITHHDAVREVNKLIRNKEVMNTISKKLGPEESAQLKPWLNDIAKDGRDAPFKTFWGSILGRLRFGTTLGVMGFKASTGIIQISGLSNTMAELGAKPVMQAMKTILGSTTTIGESWDFAVNNSKVLKFRTETMDREIRNAMQRIEGKKGFMAAVQEASMKHIAYIQTYMVDLPSWHAAYIKGMEQWGDEQRAYNYADWVIENVQGSGVTKDMSRILRNQTEEGRMFTMFMTFFSSLWNMERDLVKGAKSGVYSTTTVAAKSMFLFVLPVLFEGVMRGSFGGEDDTEEEKLQKMLMNTALYPIQSVPFLRDIASGVIGDYGYNISPLAQLVDTGVRTIPEIVTRGFTDEEVTKSQIKGATKFVGAATGVPGVSQAWATGEHLYEVTEEGEELTFRELLFGPTKE